MKRTDHILAITSGLLTVDDAAFETAATFFSQFYELQQPGKPGFVSLAGADQQGKQINYLEWIKQLRAKGIKEVYFYWHTEQHDPSMPAHIRAAFAGAPSLTMQVMTNKGMVNWQLRTLRSPQYEMKPAQLVALIDAQAQKETLWKRVEEVVNESNRLNDRAIVPAGQMPAYLQGEGISEYNFLASQMVTELQVECKVLEQHFVVTDDFQTLLYQSDFGSFYGSSNDRIPVFLYPTGKVTKEELLQLVNAQPFTKAIWEELERSLAEYTPVNIPATGYPDTLNGLDEEAVQEIAHTICRAIAQCCEQQEVQPIIPASLLHCIGPDELDGKRARARSMLGDKQWYLQSIQQPWELYWFIPVNIPAVPKTETAGDIKDHFVSALRQIAALATRMQTVYAEAFQSAEFLLSDTVPAGTFNEEHAAAISAAMQQKGFSEQAITIFNNKFSFIKDMHLLQWSAERILGLCAVSMADVFGGMGSWNDLDPGEEGPEYQRLSADLFDTMQRYFAFVLGTV